VEREKGKRVNKGRREEEFHTQRINFKINSKTKIPTNAHPHDFGTSERL
jgi:hypothetical protein